MLAPGDDPEAIEPPTRHGRRRTVESDRACPWCGSTDLRTHKKIISPKGFGIIAYILFPFALLYWLTSTTYNVCQRCEARWQRGVLMAARRAAPEEAPAAPEPEARAGMYAEQVPAAAIVRRRPRLGAQARASVPTGDVELRASREACRLCRQAAGRYDGRDAPVLPIVGCTCEGGCTCEVVAAED